MPRRRDARRVAELFGLPPEGPETFYDGLELAIRPGQLVAVVGPSGAGKSLLLKEVLRRLPRGRGVWVDSATFARCGEPVISAVGQGSLEERLAVLSRCGLAEAAVLVRPARRLSGGQVARLALAAAMLRARQAGGALLVADEFAATLDAITARVLCYQLRRFLDQGLPLGVLLATPRAELLADLSPDEIIYKPLGAPGGKVDLRRSGAIPARRDVVQQPVPDGGDRTRTGSDDEPVAPAGLVIRRGRIGDYRALARFHYLAGAPAAHKRVWVIWATPQFGAPAGCPKIGDRHRQTTAEPVPILEPAAVAVVSPPVACCRGRNAALPGRYVGPRRRPGLRRLNEEIECISRVIVHPMYRGLGLGVALVRHALATAETPMVEALAVMGQVHPLFEKAGMYRFGAFHGGRRYVYYLARRSPYLVRRRKRQPQRRGGSEGKRQTHRRGRGERGEER